MSEPSCRTTTTPLEAVTVTAMAFGMFMFGSALAVANDFASAPFSDDDLVWLVIVEIVLATAAITFLHLRGFAVSTLAPAPTLRGVVTGCGLFFAAWLAGLLVVSPFAAQSSQLSTSS